MYDKYNSLTPLPAAGTRIPKHKGILISSHTTGFVRFDYLNVTGNTFTTGLTLTSGISILPVEVYSLNTSLPAGVTAYYMN
jgi:hypothetical protein